MKNASAINSILIAALLVLAFSCEKDTTKVVPSLTTAVVTNLTSTTATGGGNIASDGGAPITARGVCWSTSPNPTIADSKTTDGIGAGSFISSITGLTPGTTYYVRAYATNSAGTAYGNQVIAASLSTTPTLSTSSLSAVTSTTATGGGNIASDGGAPITARGVCWSTSPNPTIADSKTTDGTGTGSFISSIAGLMPGTTYYVRAYATNSVGTVYGNQVIVASLSTMPTLSTVDLSAVTATTATGGGNITSDGGAPITARGVCWSTSPNPTIADSKTTDGTGTGSFISSIAGLMPGTTYYMRAYATNSVGTVYGNQVIAASLSTMPTLFTLSLSAVTTATAAGGGSITSDGGAPITVRGVCWSTSPNPTIADSKTADGTGSGSFTSSIAGLSLGTTYYVRAYATNSAGTAYGTQLSFTTLAELPIITTASITGITPTASICGGDITYTGGAPITARGVCWSTSANPTISDNKTIDVPVPGAFTSLITGLTANTVYYVRAYATNNTGTGYGSNMSFTTQDYGTVTDINGNIYKTITIGTQTWMAENLKATKYGNGDFIETTTPATLDISSLVYMPVTPKYQWVYNGDESNVALFGRLYTWYAATDSRNVCPSGWHLPSTTEWSTLTDFLGGAGIAGRKLKESGTTHWNTPDWGATNETGFTALPAGVRTNQGGFFNQGTYGAWWTSTEYRSDTSRAWVRTIYNNSNSVSDHDYGKLSGYSVRCVQD